MHRPTAYSLVLTATLLSACSGLDLEGKDACLDHGDCRDGRVCFEARCVEPDEIPDGGLIPDGGVSSDAGAVDGPGPAALPGAVSLDCGTVDRDSDQLPDCYEESIGTSPVDPDTDGDGLEDYREIVSLAFDPGRNNYLFNPLIADVPELEVELESLPILTFEGTVTSSSEEERSQESLMRVVTRRSDRNSVVVEQNHNVGVGVTASRLRGVLGSASYGFSHNTTRENTVTWSREQTRENRETYRRLDSESTSLTGARLTASVSVRNAANLAFSLSDLSITAEYTDLEHPELFQPLANLTLDGDDPLEVDLGPGSGTQSPLVFSVEIGLGQVQAILERSSAITLRPASWRLTDESDRAFAFDQTAIAAKDAAVVIDYGPRLQAESESYRSRSFFVATSADFENKRVDARTALEGILGLELEMGRSAWDSDGDGATDAMTEEGLVAVNGARIDPAIQGYWMVRLDVDDGNETVSRILDMRTESYALEDIELRGSDVLHLVYVEDADYDGVGAREEALYATRDDDTDSDDDGISDFEEITEGWMVTVVSEEPYLVYANPAESDVDGDGWDDPQERMRGTDPNKADTDGDGDLDSEDFDPLDPEARIGQGLVAEYLFDFESDVVGCQYLCMEGGEEVLCSAEFRCGPGPCRGEVCDHADSSGSELHMGFTGTVHTTGFEHDRFGEEDRALELVPEDGPDPRFITLPPLPIRGTYSLAVWVRHCEVGCTSTAVYFAIESTGLLLFGEDFNSGGLRFDAPLVGQSLVSEDGWERRDAQWHLYVGSFDCDGDAFTMRLFRDGVEVGELTEVVEGECGFASDPVLTLQGGGARLDDLRVYDRALDENDAAVLYRQRGFAP